MDVDRTPSTFCRESQAKLLKQLSMKKESMILTSHLHGGTVLGSGAFAQVELVLYTPPDGPKTYAAVKRLKPTAYKSRADFELFVKEAKLLRRLHHRHIVGFIGLGVGSTRSQSYPTMFMVLEFMSGGSLKKHISKQAGSQRPLYSIGTALKWCIQLASAVEYLHNLRPMVIHRDLKPGNVLLTEGASGKDSKQLSSMDAKLADFGLHAVVQGKGRLVDLDVIDEFMPDAPEPVGDLDLTARTGSFFYMAPEVFLGKKYCEKVDVYSFGMIMWELFERNAVTAFALANGLASPSDLSGFARRAATGYRPPMSSNSPAPIKQLIAECWAQESTSRPSMSQVSARLQALQGELAQLGGKSGKSKGDKSRNCVIC